MTEEALRHERIKWRRTDIVNLGALPSAAGQDLRARPEPRKSRRRTPFAAFFAAAVTALLLLVGMAYVVDVSGFGREQLRREAERAIERVVGQDVSAMLGGARLSLDGSRLLGLTVSDVRLAATGTDARWIDAGAVRFGIQFLPLLRGKLALGSATIEDARIALEAPGFAKNGDWTQVLRDERGLFDPDKLPPLLFQSLERAFAALKSGSSGALELANVTLVLPGGAGSERLLVVESAELVGDGLNLQISAQGHFEGRNWTLDGSAKRQQDGAPVRSMDFELQSPAKAGEAAPAANTLGDLALTLSGQAGEGQAERIDLALRIGHTKLDLGKRGVLEGSAELAARLKSGAGEVAVERLAVAVGRSTMLFKGRAGPRPADQGAEAVYSYEMSAADALIAPTDSPGAPVALQAKVAGIFDPAQTRLAAQQLSLATGKGTARGTAALTLLEGSSPGIQVALDIADMPVSHAKQLWPWLVARQARNWSLENVSDGTVESGRIRFGVLPGRLGSGVPTTAEESWGEFTVRDASFRPFRTMPYVTGAGGRIAYRAFDADIAIAQAGMTLPSGLKLQGKDARLALRDTNNPPVIGRLEIAVTGDARAMAEFASLDPINATSKLPFAPEDLSGPAEAKVSADVPLDKGVPRERLDWDVTLDFKDLSIAKPLQGRTIAAAQGMALIEPTQAIIEATARLNDAPAELHLVEPLRPDGPARERKIEMELDDKAQERLAPGLSAILSGPVALSVDASSETPIFEAELRKAKLDLPWIGWSKGSGVPAKARFKLAEGQGGTSLTDLVIEGESFSASGSATLRDGALSTVSLRRASLTRGDEIAVELRKGERGRYAIEVSGRSFDARALLKLVTGDADRKGEAKGSKGPAVTISAKLDEVVGFNGESLRQVRLDYESGARNRAMSLEAATASGAAVSMTDGVSDGVRVLEMRSADAGAVLRFLNIYAKMQGGRIDAALSSADDGPLSGRVNARDFVLVNEERLGSVVSRRAPGSSRSLNEVVEREIDTSRVSFDRGSAEIAKGKGFLRIGNGVLRGPVIGATFQGTLFDERGRMDMTGTFMPAYGLNRLFGELPLIGAILGNGRDRGLIGVTFKLEGSAKSPQLTVNPLSVIAPGIFRSIFEY